MTSQKGTSPLKVCYTCRSWTPKHKGVCLRVNQGVGKFWHCEDWTAASEADRAAPEAAASCACPASRQP